MVYCSMVGNLRNSGNTDSNREGSEPSQAGNIRLLRGHNTSHSVLRDLIKEALSPLVVDPVPTDVLIRDIVITRSASGALEISCMVCYDCRDNTGN